MAGIFVSPSARMWTKGTLHRLIKNQLQNARFIVVSNREPYVHRHNNGRIEWVRPASGLTTALDPIMRAAGGIWVAQGSGDADAETTDARGHVPVPPYDPSYTLRRVWLPKEIDDHYYYGLANSGLWPLCHIAYHRPVFQLRDWECYRTANQIFADAILEEANGEQAFVFIQDYHFGLLPRMLKQRNPNLIVAQFWHIPWPNRETFRAFPWKEELLDGMLGNDLLGFHLRYHCANFLDTVDRSIEAMVDHEHLELTRGGKVTMVRPFPISIDFDRHTTLAQGSDAAREMEKWRERIGAMPEFLGIGIDRIDYTKGIPERLRAIDLFLEQNPAYRGRFQFLQIGVPSRVNIPDYQALNDEVTSLVESLNTKWGRNGWRPILLFRGDYTQISLIGLHRLADFCMVSSLHDGMNLVAKEYVASCVDDDGVLVLSSFTGAARELGDAVLVNPFAIDEMADSILRALTMPPEERRRRMQRLRAATAENNIYRWAGKILSTLLKFEFPVETEQVEHRAEDLAAVCP
jgi:trehalose-6-phosphate synthase